jgi:hypothetical protein
MIQFNFGIQVECSIYRKSAMFRYQLFSVLLLLTCLLSGDSLRPFAFELQTIDKVVRYAKDAKPASALAFAWLESVADGRPMVLDASDCRMLGVDAVQVAGLSLKDASVRAYALQVLGESRVPAAHEYLSRLTKDGLGRDDSQQVWPAARIAQLRSDLDLVPDPDGRNAFLEKILGERQDAISNSAVASWAVELLCDSGARSALPSIRRSIRSREPFATGEAEIRFCEARIDVLSRDTDRSRALATALDLASANLDPHLMRWAVRQLTLLGSPFAVLELARFADSVGRLPDESSVKQSLEALREEIGAGGRPVRP